MARIYDIANSIGQEKPKIILAEGVEFTINTAYKNALLINGLTEDENLKDEDKFKKIITLACGKECYDYLMKTEATITDVMLVAQAIMAGLADEDLEFITDKTKDLKKDGKTPKK